MNASSDSSGSSGSSGSSDSSGGGGGGGDGDGDGGGGAAAAAATLFWQPGWRLYGHAALYADVDTSACAFEGRGRSTSTPQYVASLQGAVKHWQLTGTNTIMSPTRNGFRVIVEHPVIRGTVLLRSANRFRWAVHWLGDTGVNSGSTGAGHTGWQRAADVAVASAAAADAAAAAAGTNAPIPVGVGGVAVAASSNTNTAHPPPQYLQRMQRMLNNSLFVHVNTIACGFHNTDLHPIPPRYFTSIHGRRLHWRTTGVDVTHEPTRGGFKLVLHFRKSTVCYGMLRYVTV
jgi:hypothetical protein